VVKRLTDNFFGRRIFTAIAVFAFSLLLIFAIGARAMNAHETASRFSALLSQLSEASLGLESELGWSLAQKFAPGDTASLSGGYRAVLARFAALRTSAGPGRSEVGTDWAAVEAEYHIDADDERARFGLSQAPMPEQLSALWLGSGEAKGLKEDVGEFLMSARKLVEVRGVYTGEHMQLLEGMRNLSQTRLLPGFRRAGELLAGETGLGGSPMGLLFACAGAAVMATLLSGAVVFWPMQRAALQTQHLLIRERDRAQASEQGNRDFLAMMSHELRTPMNGIVGFTNLLLAEKLTPIQKEHAHTIRDSSQHLLELLNGILDLSRIEAGSLKLQEDNFSLADVVADVVTLLGPQALGKRLDVSAYVDPSLPELLKGDGGRIRQILLNLAGNALKFTVSGGIAIEVRHEGGNDQTGHEIRIAVTDTGIGIAPEQQERIFRRFTQVDNSSNRRFEGSGLGLSISRELANLMNGEIGVESALDKGSTFWIRLKLASAVPPAPRLYERARITLAGKRLLVVDDNALNRRIFRLQLQGFGAEVECVPDAQAALAALAQADSRGSRYDLAIIDQMMPEIDGITLRRMIREQPQFAGLKLIISSSGGIGYDQQARALGFDAACPKPVIQEKLVAKIRELLAPGEPVAGGTVATLPAKPQAQTAQGAKNRQPRLLVAEDNPVNQRLIVTALKQAGFAIDLVTDGVEAVHAVQRQHYDLVLMDIRMPVMNGVEATQRIRALPTPAAKLPIIAMTANAMVGDREEYLAAGMNDYVAKPIDFAILLSKIRAHLPIGVAEAAAGTAEIHSLPAEKKRG
jgi:signal transduction histidine kinase/CheY-like chemotaxis protein